MNIERIVADFETCKKAAEIGLKLDTVFKFLQNTDTEETIATGQIEELYHTDWQIWRTACPAPTAEEVPLPTKAFRINGLLYFILCNRVEVSFDTAEGNGDFLYENCDNPNEATARLKMAIWLIENVPEARQWYIENGYLNEEQFKAWQESNHERS